MFILNYLRGWTSGPKEVALVSINLGNLYITQSINEDLAVTQQLKMEMKI